MSHFEYVSVAVALIYALAVGKLVAGLSSVLESSARYSVHAAWVATVLLIVATQWWGIWAAREVEWSSYRFLWVLSLPSLVLVQSGILVDQRPDTHGFRDLFYERRVRFFSIWALVALFYALTPWILGVRPWFTLGPIHLFSAALVVIAAAGLIFRGHVAHLIIVALTFGLALLALAPGLIRAPAV